MSKPDTIEIRRLRLDTHIGVPAEERAAPQTLFATIVMTPSQGFDGLADDISRTIDYHRVSVEIEAIATAHPRHLIETLATDIAGHLLANHPIRHVAVTIEKHILPNTECVAVHIERGD
jgi:dihydroneopterin aldolase